MTTCQIDFESTKFIDWKVCESITNKEILPTLRDTVEYAGLFEMRPGTEENCKDGKCKRVNLVESNLKVINKGSATSVKTTDGYCNFHTHPFSCYKGEKTLWGWPSGEDMRESVCFILRGNLFHMVYTLEGVYCIQVNPNILRILKDDELMSKTYSKTAKTAKKNADTMRGIFVTLIESYFRSTHGHRTSEYNFLHAKKCNEGSTCKDTSRRWGICMPGDWVEYTNKFKLSNMTSSSNSCPDSLPCNGFPEYDEKESVAIHLKDYLTTYGFDPYEMTKDGKITVLEESSKYSNSILDRFDKLVNIMEDEMKTNLSYGGEKWNKGQIFKCKLVYNKFLKNPSSKLNPEYITFLDWMDNLEKNSKKNSKELCKLIYAYWEKFQNQKESPTIKFDTISIKFRPFNNTGKCSLADGKQISDYLLEHSENYNKPNNPKKRTTKKKKK